MATSTPKQVGFQPLSELLPKNETGATEFKQIVSVLLCLNASRSRGQEQSVVPTRIGPGLWLAGHTLYVSRFPSQKDGGNYRDLLRLANEYLRLETRKQPTRLVVLEPRAAAHDFQQFLDAECKTPSWRYEATLWDAVKLQDMLVAIPPLGLRYYPDLLPGGSERRQAIMATRQVYDQELAKLHGKIQFVGMSVYTEPASASVDIDRIYIPLRVVPEGTVESDTQVTRTDPLSLLTPWARHVILGDPGSGKTTLLHFLALAGSQAQLMKRYGTHKDDRLPVLVTLRRYADELTSRPDLSLLDYLLEFTRSDLGLSAVDTEFFDYYLYAGQAILLLDGLDELSSPHLNVAGSTPHDTDEHGTHCAGTLVGASTSGRFIGVAPEAKLAAALVLNGEEGGTDAQVLAGIDWAVETGVDVISLSLGGLVMDAETPPTYTEAILSCIEAGIPVVAAIGNEGQQTTGSLGNDLFALSVGATDSRSRVAGFSGGRTQILRESDYIDAAYLPLAYSKPDLSAPGVAIYSSVPGGGWKSFNGTSMAAPHVAGAIALLLSATSIKEKETGAHRAYLIQDLICGSVEELGESGQDHRYGFGRLDALRAIDFARQRGY